MDRNPPESIPGFGVIAAGGRIGGGFGAVAILIALGQPGVLGEAEMPLIVKRGDIHAAQLRDLAGSHAAQQLDQDRPIEEGLAKEAARDPGPAYALTPCEQWSAQELQQFTLMKRV